MKKIKERGYIIYICTDIIEWAQEFYGMPENSKLVNKEEVSKECMGFAAIETKEIWIFVPKKYKLQDLKETIAHEFGHLMAFEYSENQEDDEFQELKANHYSDFFLLTDNIIEKVVYLLKN